jgi:hypothetical protein
MPHNGAAVALSVVLDPRATQAAEPAVQNVASLRWSERGRIEAAACCRA